VPPAKLVPGVAFRRRCSGCTPPEPRALIPPSGHF